MMYLGNLEVEDIQEIENRLSKRRDVEKFALAVKSFLQGTPLDGGADSDLIFMTGVRLARAKIWEHIPAKVLAAHLRDVSLNSINLFLERAPQDYRQKVTHEIDDIRQEISSDPLNLSWALRQTRVAPVSRTPPVKGPTWVVKDGIKGSHLTILPPPPGEVSANGSREFYWHLMPSHKGGAASPSREENQTETNSSKVFSKKTDAGTKARSKNRALSHSKHDQ